MHFAGMSYPAIVIAAAAGFFFGAIYYTLLSKPWLRAVGLSKKKNSRNPAWTPFVIAAIANLVMAWVLAGVIGHLGAGQVTIRNGMISGAFIWLGFVATTLAVNNAFAGRKPMLSVIDAGHWLGVLLVSGAVIGLFGV